MMDQYMQQALSLAKHAGSLGEVPVGALVVQGERVIGVGYNQRELTHTVTRHAEMMAIEQACRALHSWRLVKCTLYVTLEPCLMCAGAIYQARIEQVVYGCRDPKFGAVGSLYEIHRDLRLNHRFGVTEGILQEESAQLLRDFFKERRKIKTP
jgi:tRNA(adenine34) deaminase